MARNTAKLGGAASDVVVAKIAVSHGNPLTRPLHSVSLDILLTVARSAPAAWAHEDDLEADAHPGRRVFRVDQSGHRRSASRCEDVSQQR